MINCQVPRHYPSFRHAVADEPGASANPRRWGGRQRQLLMRRLLLSAIILIACLSSAVPTTAATSPRTVLVLNRSIPYTEYFGKVFASFQSTLRARSDIPITIYSEGLGYSHFKGPKYDSLLHAFITEKYSSTPIGALVAEGFDALQFAVRLRADLNPAIPIVFSSIDDSTAAELSLPPNATGTTVPAT